MENCGANFEIDRQPVLPLVDLLSQNKVEKVAPLPIGSKIKSFEIKRLDRPANSTSIELPNFTSLEFYQANLNGDRDLDESQLLDLLELQSSLRAIARFWWNWLLSLGSRISILALLILFQTSSEANNLLERAKIYIDLNSQEAATLPDSGRVYLNDSQASPFNQAIAKAREIEKSSPFYPQAAKDINRWSETILDIAKGRAGEGDFTGAIAAAELIPQNYTPTEVVAREANKAMQDWQQIAQKHELYQNYLLKARISIDPERASSYAKAIGILRQIPPEAEEYQDARELIDRWNEQIYIIVQSRATKGDFKRAVEAALLISRDSIYHQLAQDSIERTIKSMYVRYIE